jgi:hypothetical protein
MGHRFNYLKEIIIEMDGEELIEIRSGKMEMFFDGSEMKRDNISKIIRDNMEELGYKIFKRR